jgi:ribokinase
MTESKFDVVTVGSATRDVFVRSDLAKVMTFHDMRGESAYLCLEHGGKQNVSNIFFTTGGGATNVAAVMSRLGLKTAAAACVGSDESADDIGRELKALGVDKSMLVRHPEERSGYSVIISSFDGERTVLTYRGASALLSPKLLDWDHLARARWVFLGSLHGVAAELYPEIAAFCRRKGVRLATNPGSSQFRLGLDGMREVLAAADVLLLNREEATKLVGATDLRRYVDETLCSSCGECVRGCPQGIFRMEAGRVSVVGEDRCTRCNACVEACPTRAVLMEPWARNCDELFTRLAAHCRGTIVITDGPRGAQCYDGKTRRMLPAFDVPTVCSLGAGDAFGATFVAALIDDPGDVGRALAWAGANAASVVTIMGAKNGIQDRPGLEAFLAKRGDWRSMLRSAELKSAGSGG